MLRDLTKTIGRTWRIPLGEPEIFSYYGAEPYWETHKEEKTFRGGGGGGL